MPFDLFLYSVTQQNIWKLQKAYDGILKDREAEAKQQRAREAREKQDRERAERAAKKKALVDFNAPGDQVSAL